MAEIDVIVVIAAHLASLDADARIIERAKPRLRLRKKPGLDLLGNLQLLRDAALGFLPFSRRAALRFHFACHFIKTDQSERISIHIPEARKHAAPDRLLGAGRSGPCS